MNGDKEPRLRSPTDISYIKILIIILSRWYWIVAISTLGLLMGYFYLRYSLPVYTASASIKFEEKRSEIAELITIRNIYERTNKVESEKLIIKSRNVLLKAISKLNHQISYYDASGLVPVDLYPEKPFPITLISVTDLQMAAKNSLQLKAISPSAFQLCCKSENKSFCHNYKYGQTIFLPGITLKIFKPKAEIRNKISYILKFNNPEDLLKRVNKSLQIDETQNVNVLTLTITDHNPYFATNILNSILDEYLIFDRTQRSASAFQTENFIGPLLKSISDTLKRSGQAMQTFKEENSLAGPSSNATDITNNLSNLEAELHILNTRGILITSIEKKLTENESNLNYDLQGMTDPQLNNLLIKFNDLLIKRKEALNNFTPNALFVQHLNQQIDYFKTAITNNISAQHKNFINTQTFLTNQIDSIRQNLSKLPETERRSVELQSKFDVNQKVYNYLEEKKLESQIAKAAVISGAMIIDRAVYPTEPISPIQQNVYILSILLSVTLSSFIIFTLRVLNPFIYNEETIKQFTTIPIIGIIRKYTGPIYSIPYLSQLNSLFSESIRAVRSSLNFLASESQCKIICITSEISGEGKSFVSLNLASSLTLIEKRVLLIAADLRKPSLHNALNLINQNGLSSYLSEQATINQIIVNTEVKNLDFICSGPIPPNPSELLHRKKMHDTLIEFKKKYDFILIDSAPIGIVSDGIPLIKIADINLFILRTGISKKQYTLTPEKLSKEFELTNIYLILNDFKDSAYHNNYYTGCSTKTNQKEYYHPYQTNSRHHREYLDL